MKKAELYIILTGILAALLICEIALRFYVLPTAHALPKSDRPKRYYFSELSRSNRDFAHAAVKEDSIYRIIVVGDSFTFGYGVAVDDTFAKRLERLLNLNKIQKKVEVINLGVPGLSTHHEVSVVKKGIARLAPDLVLLQITLNDPELKPYQAPHQIKHTGTSSGLLQHWKTLSFITQRMENYRSRRAYKQYFQNLWIDAETVNNFERSIKSIANIARQNNVRLAAVLFPLVTFPTDAGNYPFTHAHQVANEIVGKNGIPFSDLLPAFAGMDVIRLQAQPDIDPHPSEIAHRIAAEQILVFLKKNRLIPTESFPHLSSRERIVPVKF